MPYDMGKERKGKGYYVKSPHGYKGRNMTKRNAMRQRRLLQALKYDPDFKEKLRA